MLSTKVRHAPTRYITRAVRQDKQVPFQVGLGSSCREFVVHPEAVAVRFRALNGTQMGANGTAVGAWAKDLQAAIEAFAGRLAGG